MFSLPLDDIREDDVRTLVENETEESIRLEFKRQLNIDDRKHKAEAAKDVSALANTVGGRILYGIAEKTLADGATVASEIMPLQDAALEDRLHDVLNSNIHPRPHFRTRRVPIGEEGFVLVVEVYERLGGDLFMVEGFKEYRFYKRGEKGTILMTEPEIREAYARIAASRQALDAAMEKTVQSELGRVPKTHQSIFVIPWYGHNQRIDPRRFGDNLGWELVHGPLREVEAWHYVFKRLRVVSRGYGDFLPSHEGVAECQTYVLIDRSGMVHLAEARSENGISRSYPQECLSIAVPALLTARYLLAQAAYWGPVRVIHHLKATAPFTLSPGMGSYLPPSGGDRRREAGEYDHVVPEVTFAELGNTIQPILRELMDQVFQTGGWPSCPWFDESGDLKSKMPLNFGGCLVEHLRKPQEEVPDNG